MARLPRLVLAGQPHLVIQRALVRHAAFADAEDRARLFDVLREALAAERVQLHAYALRSDELRLLVTPPEVRSLARLMQAIGRRYVVAYNRRHGRSGTLWDGRFRAAAVEPGEPLLGAMVWVEQTDDASAATSAAHHLGKLRDVIVTDPPAYWRLGNTPFEREAVWRERLAHGLSAADALRLRRAALGGWAIGSPAFVAAAAASGRPAEPRPRGRPRRAQATPRQA